MGRRGGFTFSKQKANKGTFTRLLAFVFKGHKLKLTIVMVAMLVATITNVLATYFVQFVLKEAIELGTNFVPGNPISLGRVPLYVGIIIGFYVLTILSSIIHLRLMIVIGQEALVRMRNTLFKHLTGLSLKFFDSHKHGDLMSRFTNDVDATRQLVSQSLPQVVVSALTLLGYTIAMGIISPIMLLLSLVVIIILLLITKQIIKSSKPYFFNQQKAIGMMNGYIEEMVEGQKVVKVFMHEDAAVKDFKNISQEVRINATRANVRTGVLIPVTVNISYLNFALSAMLAAFLYSKGLLDVGQIITYMLFIRNLTSPLNQLSQQISFVATALAGASRIFEILDQKYEVDEGYYELVNATYEDNVLVEADHITHIWAWKNTRNNELTHLKGDVRFIDVTFGYDEHKKVLTNVSLYAKPGQKIAFVGATGAGKTTITNLINRFYDVNEGMITYDGINIKDIKKPSLRKSLGVVLQDTSLFTDTVENNIRYGRLEATREEIIEAAKLANAHEFIIKLPEGYNTVLTDNASNLSQGQRQLLSIARAAVANPPVLILDEATSSIDTYTEKLIQQGMDKLMHGRTVFVIAHRLSTIKNSKAIIVLSQGEIIERGTHQDLIDIRGNYYQLYTGLFELE